MWSQSLFARDGARLPIVSLSFTLSPFLTVLPLPSRSILPLLRRRGQSQQRCPGSSSKTASTTPSTVRYESPTLPLKSTPLCSQSFMVLGIDQLTVAVVKGYCGAKGEREVGGLCLRLCFGLCLASVVGTAVVCFLRACLLHRRGPHRSVPRFLPRWWE